MTQKAVEKVMMGGLLCEHIQTEIIRSEAEQS